MRWVKKGLIYCPDGQFKWNCTHAQVPIIDLISDTVWRIYYTTRDVYQRSRVSYIEVEAGNPQNILYKHKNPILDIGLSGRFDDCGVMCSSIINLKQKIYLYYVGWNVRNTVAYHNSLGVAVSEDSGKTFNKCFQGPVMDRSIYDPYMCTSCDVIIRNGTWKAWYTSGTKWEMLDGKLEPFYNIKFAESDDGFTWKRNEKVAINYKHDKEAISCPSIICEENKYRMWYSYRNVLDYRNDKNNSYRIGYAESIDGKEWTRLDEQVGIDISGINSEWDSQMIAYPRVFKYKGLLYMLYNGNGFGRSGFGYAVCAE